MGEKSSPPGFSFPQQEGTLHRFSYSPQEAFLWSRAQDCPEKVLGGAAGAGVPQAGFDASSLDLE